MAIDQKKLFWGRGFGFGLASGVITTIGMLIGLYEGTKSRLVVILGIISIAVADSFSDALGLHITEESQLKPERTIWLTTLMTWLSKFFFTMTFTVPVLLFEIDHAIIVSVIYGISLIAVYSYFLGKERRGSIIGTISEHVAIAFSVISITYYVGRFFSSLIP